MAAPNAWTRDQLLLALRLYMNTPFGRLHGKNRDIIRLAGLIGRTPGAMAMKASNFANIDPNLNRAGLKNSSQADRDIWEEFAANPTKLAIEAEEAAERLAITESPSDEIKLTPPDGETARESLVRVRRVQSFFREAVLVSYGGRCAISGLKMPELLVASHIIPWSDSVERRADPTNGLLLNALLDKAFDRGLITIDDRYRVVISATLLDAARAALLPSSLMEVAGRELELPSRFRPDRSALKHHRQNVFRGE